LLRDRRGFRATRTSHRHALYRGGFIITRAQGGIGDILMMLGAISRLRARTPPHHPIVFALSRKYLPLAIGLDGVTAVPAEEMDQYCPDFRTWIDLTACPASFVEGRSAPRITWSRVDIFSKAILGYRDRGVSPWYRVLPEELDRAQALLDTWGICRSHALTVGVQLRSADNYKDYPHISELLRQLSSHYSVIAFTDSLPPGDLIPEVKYVSGMPIRDAFAVASLCDCLVCPDSAFLHLAEALGRPCVALTGPTDGQILTKSYRHVTFVDTRNLFPCMPCWRNQYSPCIASRNHDSACLRAIPVDAVITAVARRLIA